MKKLIGWCVAWGCWWLFDLVMWLPYGDSTDLPSWFVHVGKKYQRNAGLISPWLL